MQMLITKMLEKKENSQLRGGINFVNCSVLVEIPATKTDHRVGNILKIGKHGRLRERKKEERETRT